MAKRGRPPVAQATYPNRLREIRELRGETLKEVARRAGMSDKALARYEVGDRELKVRHLEQLARALSVPPQRLLSSVDPATDEREQAMVAVFRRLVRGDQDRLLKMAMALIPERAAS